MKLRVLCLCFWVSALRWDLRTRNGSEAFTLADLKGGVADISTCGVWNHNVTWCQETARRPRLLTNKAALLSCCVWTGKKKKRGWLGTKIYCLLVRLLSLQLTPPERERGTLYNFIFVFCWRQWSVHIWQTEWLCVSNSSGSPSVWMCFITCSP